GSGALYGKKEILEQMEPFLYGGDMIGSVWMDHATWNDLPWKFEAGTPSIAQQIGLGAAVDYLSGLGMEAIRAHEQELTTYALEQLNAVPGVRVIGNAPQRGGVVSFEVDGIHPHDLSQLLDQDGVAVRAGNHCAQPLHRLLGLAATCRASFYFYNTKAEVDALVTAVQHAKEFFGAE
ncbi:MAG TPA: aminotransferase class V-fold PLP-dependent enzyme, partial [Armatimonadota bacterium]|nr:aminotransferase class V-fold PLP-dependent enzyme [Armatimonadota bacterium]